ncbi:MAG: metallophosphoesterase, partial [Nitrososphaeraceae archaeon]|nr:metallophosphoesterase [Nitrososphaeraceae archaeon]
SYELDLGCWLEIVQPISSKMKAAIGNHDVYVSNILNQYMDRFNLTNQYYSFDYDNIHFLVMSSEFLYLPDSEQYRFIEKDLKENSKNPDTKWTIVISHKQQYSSQCGNHDSCDPVKRLRNIYHPIFQNYDVDLLISGHAHNYQRSYPLIYNELNSSQPVLGDAEQTSYNSPKGMIQIVAGMGGVDHDNFSNHEPFIVYQDDVGYGFFNIDISKDGNVLRGTYFVNEGKKLDEFTITK